MATQQPTRLGTYYGWYLTASLMLIPVTLYGIYFVGIGPSVIPLQQEFGWTRTFIAGAFSFGAMFGFAAPFTGFIIDRMGPRLVLIVGGVVVLLGGLCNAFTDSSGILWYIGWVLLGGFASILTGYPNLNKLASVWFLRRRGFVIGLITFSGAFCYFVTSIHAALINAFGWRGNWVIMGVAGFVVISGVGLLVARNRPEEKGWHQDGVPMTPEERAAWARGDRAMPPPPPPTTAQAARADVSFTIGQALRNWVPWAVGVAGAIASMALTIQSTQQLPYLAAMGVPSVVAGAVIGVMGLAGAPGRLIAGWLSDRYGKGMIRFWYALSLLLQAAGMFILIQATSVELVWVFVVVFGLGQGMSVTVPVTLFAFYYGSASFSTLYGTFIAVIRVGTVLGPVFAAFIFDTSGSYTIAFTVTAVALVIGAVILLFCAPPKLPAARAG